MDNVHNMGNMKYTLPKLEAGVMPTPNENSSLLVIMTRNVANELAIANDLKKIELNLKFGNEAEVPDTEEKPKKDIKDNDSAAKEKTKKDTKKV